MSAQELKEKGYRNWLKNIRYWLDDARDEDALYYWRVGNQPTQKTLMYVYILIAGRIRYRGTYVETIGPQTMNFGGRELFGKAWVCMTGPLVRAPFRIERKGFQGFRYTKKLF